MRYVSSWLQPLRRFRRSVVTRERKALYYVGPILEISDGTLKTLLKFSDWRPTKHFLSQRNIGLTLAWVIARQWFENEFTVGPGQLNDELGQFKHRKLYRISNIDRPGEFIGGSHGA